MAAVTLKAVHKSFADQHVIKGVSIEVGDGEFCVLVGPSGSGKSTLLRIVAGLEDVSSGELSIGGRIVTDLPPKQRDIAMVFQSYALYPQLTVRENMSFGLKLAKRPRAEIARKVDAAAQMLGLDALLDRYPKQLSGGQRQRVAMGRAIVRNPQVFLFDEPLSNLDAALRHQVRGEIRDLHQRLHTTCLYVTHDQIEAMTMGDRIVVLRDGRVEQTGSPLELYDRPANRFVAGFIGSPAMNMADGRCRRRGGVVVIEFADHSSLSLPAYTKAYEGDSLTYGIRPEHMLLATAGQPGISGKVKAIEFTGADTQVICETAIGTLTTMSKERPTLGLGDPVRLQPLRERLHVFDREGGQRLC
jgi:multiple sugar transport system ATP-binding protein